MKKSMLALLLALLPAGAACAADSAQARTETVQLGGLTVSRSDISVVAEDDYVRILVDIFPSQKQRKQLGAKFKYKDLAVALVKGPAKAAQPKMAAFKLDIAEYSQRDDYAQPVFSAYKPLWHGEGKLGADGKVSFHKIVQKDP